MAYAADKKSFAFGKGAGDCVKKWVRKISSANQYFGVVLSGLVASLRAWISSIGI